MTALIEYERTASTTENALRDSLGGTEVHTEQLHHLLKMSELPNVEIRIVASSTGRWNPTHAGSFICFDFDKAAPGDSRTSHQLARTRPQLHRQRLRRLSDGAAFPVNSRGAHPQRLLAGRGFTRPTPPSSEHPWSAAPPRGRNSSDDRSTSPNDQINAASARARLAPPRTGRPCEHRPARQRDRGKTPSDATERPADRVNANCDALAAQPRRRAVRRPRSDPARGSAAHTAKRTGTTESCQGTAARTADCRPGGGAP